MISCFVLSKLKPNLPVVIILKADYNKSGRVIIAQLSALSWGKVHYTIPTTYQLEHYLSQEHNT